MTAFRDTLERHQIRVYFAAALLAWLLASLAPALTVRGAPGIEPALGVMLYVTFLQVPITTLIKLRGQLRFLTALLLANFVIVPLLLAALLSLAPAVPMLQLGILLVLLCPCIDYVVTFAQMGRADARRLLAATPVLLLLQLLLLPLYLRLFLDAQTAALVHAGPFLRAFASLILLPLVLAWLTQVWSARSRAGARVHTALNLLPVPMTALVLCLVIAALLPRVSASLPLVASVLPIYVIFAFCAPLLGWASARLLRLPAEQGRAVAFSSGTRNSLVILPLALAVPDAAAILPVVILSQTLVELIAELVYIACLARLGAKRTAVE